MKMTKKGITGQFCFELIDTAYVSRLQKRLKMYTSFFLIQQNKNLRKTVHDNIYYSWQIAIENEEMHVKKDFNKIKLNKTFFFENKFVVPRKKTQRRMV